MALLVNNRRAGKHLYSEDGRSSKEADRAFQAVGWNQNDADLFKYWVFLDEQVYSTRKIASVHAALTAPAPTVSEWTAAVVLVRQKLFSIKKPVNLLFVLLSVVLVLDSCLFVRVSAVLIWTGALILLTVTELLFKLPAHVSGPTLCAAVLSVILIRVFARPARSQGTETSSSDSIPSRSSSVCGRLSTIALAGSLCLSTYLVTHYYSYSRLGVRYRRPFLNCVDRLEKGPDHIYLIVLQFPFQRTSLFDTMAAWEDWHFIYTDGDVRSPRYYTFLKEHNIDDLTTALYTDPRLHIITIEPVMTRITQFLKDHRGVDVEYSVRDMPPIKVFSLRERTIDSSETL